MAVNPWNQRGNIIGVGKRWMQHPFIVI